MSDDFLSGYDEEQIKSALKLQKLVKEDNDFKSKLIDDLLYDDEHSWWTSRKMAVLLQSLVEESKKNA